MMLMMMLIMMLLDYGADNDADDYADFGADYDADNNIHKNNANVEKQFCQDVQFLKDFLGGSSFITLYAYPSTPANLQFFGDENWTMKK